MEPWPRWTYQHCPWRPSSSLSLTSSLCLFLHLLQAIISNTLHQWINESYRTSSSPVSRPIDVVQNSQDPCLGPCPAVKLDPKRLHTESIITVKLKILHHLKKPLENPSTPISRNPDTIEGISLEDCKFSQFPNAACVLRRQDWERERPSNLATNLRRSSKPAHRNRFQRISTTIESRKPWFEDAPDKGNRHLWSVYGKWDPGRENGCETNPALWCANCDDAIAATRKMDEMKMKRRRRTTEDDERWLTLCWRGTTERKVDERWLSYMTRAPWPGKKL